jgi:hypothetical protein
MANVHSQAVPVTRNPSTSNVEIPQTKYSGLPLKGKPWKIFVLGTSQKTVVLGNTPFLFVEYTDTLSKV